MRIFVQKKFGRWAAEAGLTDDALMKAAKEAFAGQVEGDLGSGLFKKRIARVGGGKAGGFRTILCFRKANSERIFFLHGFPKNDKGNITDTEEKALKKVAVDLIKVTDAQLVDLEKLGTVRELKDVAHEKT